MEDRLTQCAYLEMTDATPDEFASRRARELVEIDGVERVTWWENAHPNRRDLPRELAEFSLLTVCEADESFRPPQPAGGATCHLFRRYPRPAQGSLSPRPTSSLLLVLISPKDPDRAQELRDWADFVHIRHIATSGVPGFCMITPFERVGEGDPRYMHLYEMDSGDPEAAFAAMVPRVMDRLGASQGDPAFEAWARHPQLRIVYVNTFKKLGAMAPSERAGG